MLTRELAWRCKLRTMFVVDAISRQNLQWCRLAPGHGNGDQFVTRGNSVVACTVEVELHTVHSVANTQNHDR